MKRLLETIRLPSQLAQTDKQATWKLLAILRLVAFSTVVALFGVAEFLQLHVLQAVADWRQISMAAAIAVGLSVIGLLTCKFRISSMAIYLQLVIDTGLWFFLLQASGGAMNPAISYLLVLLSIAALSLSLLPTLSLLVLMMMLYTVIMDVQPAMDHAHMFAWHLWGMWALFFFTALILMTVIYLLSRKLREKDQAIANYKEETVRAEQMLMLGTMAANITHELGTPLSTIAMLVEEADLEQGNLIQKQINRCKSALRLLKSVDYDNEAIAIMEAQRYFEHLQQELLLIQPAATLQLAAIDACHIKVSGLLTQALLALLNNAVEAAASRVTLKAWLQQSDYIVEISHDGKAIDEGLIKLLGLQPVESSREGLGMGYYLANISIERLQGRLKISNQASGVVTTVIFKQADILQ